MKLLIFIVLIGSSFLNSQTSFAEINQKQQDSKELVLVGRIPGIYLGENKSESYLGLIVIKDRLITEIKKVTWPYQQQKKKLEQSQKQQIFVPFLEEYKKRNAKIIIASTDNGRTFDILYPGLINLHNHTKQNNLPVWNLAHGQFENRFEWRAWSDYKKSVSGNMNPWISYGSQISCAAFRWSELQAMTLGTVYLQGPSDCVDGFAIHRVEDANAYISNKKAVQAPTDIIVPNDMTFIWQTLRPIIKEGKSYEEALAQVITQGVGNWKGCDGLKEKITAENINSPEILKIFSNQAELKKSCNITKETENILPDKFVRYVYWIHKTIAGKKKYLEDPASAAIITHLAEGRRDDAYNKKEFKILELLGFIRPHMNLVHAVGVDYEDLKKIVRNDMGIVWSVFSNLLLYGETLDLRRVKEAEKEIQKEFPHKKILLAMGSDWVPTGSKSVLEEMRVARDYIDKNQLQNLYSDEDIYHMVTENPAKMIQHWEINIEKGEHGIGRLAVGAMGSVIALKANHRNPYTNLVRYSDEKAVNLVVVDGSPQYGNFSYLQQAGYDENSVEFLNRYICNFKSAFQEIQVPSPFLADSKENGETFESDNDSNEGEQTVKNVLNTPKLVFLYSLGKIAKNLVALYEDHCDLPVPKAFVKQDSLEKNNLIQFLNNTGLNLDRYEDLQRILGINILTQTKNRAANESSEYLIQYFPPLLSCNDDLHKQRIDNMLVPSKEEEDQNIRDLKNRENFRKLKKLGSIPKKLANQYQD